MTKPNKNSAGSLATIEPFKNRSSKGAIRAIIETPQGSRNKYAFNPEERIFELSKVLPEGMDFPHDFGFIPSTKADDGDPIDVVILMDEPAFPGCLLEVRLVGVIEGKQTEKGRWIRNDRLIAVANQSHTHSDVEHISELNPNLLDELERFFENYHQHAGHKYKSLGRKGPKRALELMKNAIRTAKKSKRGRGFER
jgi:inorganic pyrophosphatase